VTKNCNFEESDFGEIPAQFIRYPKVLL